MNIVNIIPAMFNANQIINTTSSCMTLPYLSFLPSLFGLCGYEAPMLPFLVMDRVPPFTALHRHRPTRIHCLMIFEFYLGIYKIAWNTYS